jgi:hypothetical protein
MNEQVSFAKELLTTMRNMAVNKLVVSSIPDEKTATYARKLLSACNRHGVETETMLKIFKDLADGGMIDEN